MKVVSTFNGKKTKKAFVYDINGEVVFHTDLILNLFSALKFFLKTKVYKICLLFNIKLVKYYSYVCTALSSKTSRDKFNIYFSLQFRRPLLKKNQKYNKINSTANNQVW